MQRSLVREPVVASHAAVRCIEHLWSASLLFSLTCSHGFVDGFSHGFEHHHFHFFVLEEGGRIGDVIGHLSNGGDSHLRSTHRSTVGTMDQPLLPLSSLSPSDPSGHDVRSRRFVHASFPHLVVFDGGLFFAFLHALVPGIPSDRRHAPSATTTHLRSILFVLPRIRAVDRRRPIRRRTLSFLFHPSPSILFSFHPHVRRPRTLPWRRRQLLRRRRMRHHRWRRGCHHHWTCVSHPRGQHHVHGPRGGGREEGKRGRQTSTCVGSDVLVVGKEEEEKDERSGCVERERARRWRCCRKRGREVAMVRPKRGGGRTKDNREESGECHEKSRSAKGCADAKATRWSNVSSKDGERCTNQVVEYQTRAPSQWPRMGNQR